MPLYATQVGHFSYLAYTFCIYYVYQIWVQYLQGQPRYSEKCRGILGDTSYSQMKCLRKNENNFQNIGVMVKLRKKCGRQPGIQAHSRKTLYSLYQAKCRDISRYISVVFRYIEPNFGTRNKCKMCMLNFKIYPCASQIKACFFFVSVIYF